MCIYIYIYIYVYIVILVVPSGTFFQNVDVSNICITPAWETHLWHSSIKYNSISSLSSPLMYVLDWRIQNNFLKM